MVKAIALVALLGAAASVNAQTLTTYADRSASTLGSGFTATVQPGGVRAAPNGANFFNIEGRNNGSFASWGAVRFDLSAAYAQLNTLAQQQFGANGTFTITGAAVTFYSSNAAFTAPGLLEVYRVANDTLSIDPNAPGAGFGIGTTLGGNRMYNGVLGAASSLLGTINFTQSGSGNNGVAFGTSINTVLGLGELNGLDNALTLVIDTNSLTTAATFEGQSGPFNGINGPALTLNYTLAPTPGAAAMFGIAAVAGLRRRR